ncbi:NadS family protein [Acidihalobacter ferrooxydans]|uniref:Transcriptional regulator n=1 Tax=Acidihalobacter ferrooxydans TaxID=1765967 RepID=A0A1P8UHV4_9GAMM|nr:NadS family protein [Acidihalobacter ferrooxydans]APZ43341.1 transcriptional regulator [Acidihalobacter ferrooxydans]
MDKSLFTDLLQSLEEAKAIRRGETKPSRRFTVSPPDAKSLRERVGLSQSEFAQMIGVSIDTLQNWEQHRRNPSGPAAALLRLVSANPELALRALNHPR